MVVFFDDSCIIIYCQFGLVNPLNLNIKRYILIFIAAFLTVNRMVTTIENVEDLAKSPDMKYGIVRSGATQEFFQVILFIFNKNKIICLF
jgi:hypothetical protein